MGAIGTRLSPRPLNEEGGSLEQTSRESRGEIAKLCVAVIASEAKQSIEQQERKLDCFASLAMTISGTTRHTLNRHRPLSRGMTFLD